MKKVFNGRQLHDTVYVTANPHAEVDLQDGVFHAVENLLSDDWDSQLKTVPPEKVVERTIEAHKAYPKKRLIIHFMQPHFPFIGPTGTEINAGIQKDLYSSRSQNPWHEQMWGERYDRGVLVEAYRENHKIAYDEVKRLLGELDGRSVVTADHANLIGERGFPIPIRLYGHPEGFPHPNLLTVPWIEWDGERRDVTAEQPIEQKEMENSVVNDRLESLGYR